MIWTFIGVLVLTVCIVGVGLFGALQLQPVKDQVAHVIQNQFSKEYEGVLHIGSINGFLPFQVQLNDVKIYPDSSALQPVFESSDISASVDVLSVFRKQFVMNSLEIQNPVSAVDFSEGASLASAFKSVEADISSTDSVENVSEDFGFQIIIPSVKVFNGNMVFRNIPDTEKFISSGDSLRITGLNIDLFFEYTEVQRFMDINSIRFNAPEAQLYDVELFGQFYNDDRFFELNAFNINVDNSTIRFSGEADGINLLSGNIRDQFVNSNLSFSVDRFLLSPGFIRRFNPDLTSLNTSLETTLNGEGTVELFTIETGEFVFGDSYGRFNAELTELKSLSSIGYDVDIQSLTVGEEQLYEVQSVLTENQAIGIASGNYEASISGNREETALDFSMEGERGTIRVNGDVNWTDQMAYNFSFTTDSLDIGNIFTPNIQQLNLTVEGEINSTGMDFKNSRGGLVIRSSNGEFDNRSYEQFSFLANWENGIITPEIRANMYGSSIALNGEIDINDNNPRYFLTGSAQELQLQNIIQHPNFRSVTADIEYELDLRGNNLNELYGQASFDVLQAVAGTDTLDRHQLYFDLNGPEEANRMLRFTSTAFDATVEGSYNISSLIDLSNHWASYLKTQVDREFRFKSVNTLDSALEISENQNITLNGRIKSPNIINFYLDRFPELKSSARINSSVNVNSRQLLFNASFVDQETTFGNFSADSLSLQATGSFRYEVPFKEFSSLEVQANASSILINDIPGQGMNFSANLDRDSLYFSNTLSRLSDESSFRISGNGKLMDEAVQILIEEFSLGTESYQWENNEKAGITYRADERLSLENFVFENQDQFLQVEGTFSAAPEDSVNYRIENLNLQEVSTLLGGRLSFGGRLNGEFTTRTLTTVPTVLGNVDIDTLTFGGTLVGDLNLSSRYNNQFDRFDTNISVYTDSTKYPEYFENTGRKGQNFTIDGYVLAPQDGQFPDTDSLYQFNVDFENIDLWILPLIAPKVFSDGSGLAQGSGVIWGNADDYDFNADLMVGSTDAAYLRPQFLDTYYYAQGGLSFTRDDGLSFNDIYLLDPSGGNAILSGYYDFNDFTPTDSLYIRLEMDEFQFLNSTFDPTLPFFGTAFGSSTVTISGTNFAPVLRTEEPMQVSDFSGISIPLLEETELNEDNRFIRFVESFEDYNLNSRRRFSSRNRNTTENEEDEVDLSFAERFTLDLQFVTDNPMTVRLIFDPVTGDIVTAEGTGRLRILLEDQDFSMFGRFDIEGGRYQFVSGDIFTRRFELESGGSIVWEGDPANASLNLNAVYTARPDINTLSAARSNDPENAQRVPVELVYTIGGTIYSIENDFFFRLPNTFESQQSSTLSTQLAAINRDENMKLIQAANFMLMGDFIPVSSAGTTQGNFFGDNISGSAALLNPLLSSQVINPLLSNQINSLLNSDLSSLDVDFNLNTYNQVDLGVALRLYNDKLILRREGQITGRQSNIGDLGATYRINQTFALTAFHRQDLTFGTLNSTEQSQQSQDINGVGLEAKVGFNTWKEFFDRILSPFRKLFGTRDGKNQEEITQNQG
ncbi:hypothetical protein [Gracilimonas sp.]|uniref:translocation/assembly module TamB domain-containing protein n=1 Tax=Gracilimonas sp. TaxID=1974203 RepID=UPI002870E8AE|nr:hypothetical protein [Gracilimonas sp.]